MEKLTREMAEREEAANMIDALHDGSFELTGEFLTKYAGDAVGALLLAVKPRDRAYVLSSTIDEGRAYFPGGIAELPADGFWLPSGEIEVQFEGEASDCFADVDDWTIHSDLAYLYTGYGLVVPVDLAVLSANVSAILSDSKKAVQETRVSHLLGVKVD